MATDSTTGAASRERLWELHGLLLDALLEYFKDPPGGVVSAAFVSAARAFLKDNGIHADAMALQDLRKSLAQLRGLSLPFANTRKEH